MAKLEAEVSANINPFSRALKQAAEKAKELAKETKEIALDIGKETGGGGVDKMLGLAGGAAAVTAFGAGIVETVKHGIEAFSEFETSAMQMGTVVKDMDLGKELTEWAEKLGGAAGKGEDFVAALKTLMQSGLNVEEAKTKLLEFRKLTAGTGEDVKELAEGFRKMQIGQGGEREGGLVRMMRSSGAVNQMVEDSRQEYIDKLQAEFNSIPRIQTAAPELQAKGEELEKARAMSTAEYAKQLSPEEVNAMIAKATGAGGQYDKAVEMAKSTTAGHEKDIQQELHEEFIELGKAMDTGFKPALDEIIKELPKLTPAFVQLGTAIGGAVKWIADHLPGAVKAAGDAYNAVGKMGEDQYANTWNKLSAGEGAYGLSPYDLLTQHPALAAITAMPDSAKKDELLRQHQPEIDAIEKNAAKQIALQEEHNRLLGKLVE